MISFFFSATKFPMMIEKMQQILQFQQRRNYAYFDFKECGLVTFVSSAPRTMPTMKLTGTQWCLLQKKKKE